MKLSGGRLSVCAVLTILSFGVAACLPGGIAISDDQLLAPGPDPNAPQPNNVDVGHRLINAGEYELAIRAFNRAALQQGALDAEILTGLGSANLGLGRLGQAERHLRRALEKDVTIAEAWNNLGVVLMEEGKTAEALRSFRRAADLDNGQSAAIANNLQLALAKFEKSARVPLDNNIYKLVRRGKGEYLIR